MVSLNIMTSSRIKKWVIVTLAVHIVTAIFSEGFKHFDEHFQILEFANYKLGITKNHELPWEFGERMRPWAQPFLAYQLIIFSKMMGIDSPFIQATILRLISALLGMLSLLLLLRAGFEWIQEEKDRSLLAKILALTWFIPFLHARFSSEGWSTTFFIIGMSLIIIDKERRRNILLAGTSLGLAFLFRYQTGLLILGLFCWSLLIEKFSPTFLFQLGLMILAMIGAGIIVDTWGYGEFTIAPWNYLYVNIFEGRSEHFGVHPWWHYFKLAITRGYPPISIVVILSIIAGWIKFPKNPLTWASVPFVLAHFLIAHKETRFLFPVIMLSPVFLALLWINSRNRTISFLKRSSTGKGLVGMIVGINCLLLIGAALKPAKSTIDFYHHIFKKRSGEIDSLMAIGGDPFKMVGLPLKFYGINFPLVRVVDDIGTETIKHSSNGRWILTSKQKQAYFIYKNLPDCTIDYSGLPEWFLKLNLKNWRVLSRTRFLTLFRCL